MEIHIWFEILDFMFFKNVFICWLIVLMSSRPQQQNKSYTSFNYHIFQDLNNKIFVNLVKGKIYFTSLL